MYLKRSLTLSLLFIVVFALPASAGEAASYVELADAPVITVDWSQGATQAVTLHGDRKLVFEHGTKGGHYMLILQQDATGGRIVAWPSNVAWPGGPSHDPSQTYVFTTTAGKKDFLSFFFDGMNYDALGISLNY